MCKEQEYIEVLIKFQRINDTVQSTITNETLRNSHNYISQYKGLGHECVKIHIVYNYSYTHGHLH